MLLNGFLTLCLAAALVPVTICDYQLEVNLISYNNSARRLADGSCCDLESSGICFQQDTCDVRLTFSVQDFRTLMTFHSQTKVIGTYDDTDAIIFPNCGTLMNNVRNPLTFIIPTNQWSAGQQLRLLVVIDDVDTNPMTGAPEQEFILGSFPIAEISRPSAPNATFTNTQTFSGANSLTLTYQYRVICSTRTCGSDCSQTTNCQPFPSCVPITCADSPCLNGGTCSDVQGGGYTCSCVPQCTGQNCGSCADPCASPNPCFNGGACTAQGINFTCMCRQGFAGATCRDMAPTGTTTDSNIPTTDGSMNQMPNTDSGTSNPDSALPMATTKEVDTQTSAGGYTAALVSWSSTLLLIWSTVLLLFP